MYKAIVFAGTTEGYALCEFLAENHVPVYACAATEYGGSLLKENEFLHVSAGRLKTEDMEELFRMEAPEIVLDATHPYAAEVTKNIRTACENGSIRYQRVLRPEGEKNREAIYVESTEKAAELLSGTEGNIFLTTGSKELSKFTVIPDYQERLFARVLSIPSVISSCAELGIEGKHLIGMQGPFSTEINEAMLRLSGHQGYRSGRWIPGKDGGLSALRRHTCDHRKTFAGGGAVPAGSKGISGKAVRPYPVTEGFSCRHRHGCGKNPDFGRKEGL